MTGTNDFLIDSEFAAWMFQTSEVCDEELERSILATGGPQDALHVAEFPVDGSADTVSVLMDGHRRFGICQKHGLPYQLKRQQFASRADALSEMDAIQLRRRNLNPTQEGIVRARLVAHRLAQNPEAKIEETLEEVAKEGGVSSRTVRRGVDTAKLLEKVAPGLRQRAAELKPADIRRLAALTEDDQHDVVRQFDAGEFTSIKAAIGGEASVDDVIETTKPVVMKPAAEKEAAQRWLGKLQDAIFDLAKAYPDATAEKVAKSYTDRLAGVLASWGN